MASRARSERSLAAEHAFRARVAELGGRVVEPLWLGANKPHRVICEAGHETSTRPNHVQQGRGICRACAGNDPATAEQAFRTRVAELGGRVVEPVWRGSGNPHQAICKAGHECAPRPSDVRGERGICRVCAGNDPATAEQAFRTRVAELGGRMVEPLWLGVDRPHRVVCRSGHESTPRPSDVKQGHGICRVCAGNDPATAERAFRSRVAELGGRVVESLWLGADRPHHIICGAGHETTARPSRVQQGRGICRACAKKDPATAERAFHARVAELGGRVVEPVWLGNHTPHRIVCRNGHEVRPRPTSVLMGQGICRVCAGKDPATNEEAFHTQVAQLGGRVVEPVWLGANTPHRIICKAGHEAKPRPSDVKQGHGLCRVCAGNDPLTTEQAFRARIAELGGHVVERVWLGANTPHRIICKAGHEANPRPAGVFNGQGPCRVCARNDPATAERAFRERVAELGGRVLEPMWLGSGTPHRVVCKAGHEATTRPAGVVMGTQGICRICTGNDPVTANREFRERVAELGGRVLEPMWLGSGTPNRVVCEADHETTVHPTSVQQGIGLCRTCAWGACDAFYVITNHTLARVKFGITSRDGKIRLGVHRRGGYQTVVRMITAIPDAAELERAVVQTLRLAKCTPVQGWEYFDITAMAVILDVVDNWPSSGIRLGAAYPGV